MTTLSCCPTLKDSAIQMPLPSQVPIRLYSHPQVPVAFLHVHLHILAFSGLNKMSDSFFKCVVNPVSQQKKTLIPHFFLINTCKILHLMIFEVINIGINILCYVLNPLPGICYAFVELIQSVNSFH